MVHKTAKENEREQTKLPIFLTRYELMDLVAYAGIGVDTFTKPNHKMDDLLRRMTACTNDWQFLMDCWHASITTAPDVGSAEKMYLDTVLNVKSG